MAKKNTNLHNAKKAKNDEFYTQLSDIEKEMAHYKEFFKGKIVYCNCDDARESNFFKFFANNFESLGLKKLISTGFKENGKGVKLVYEGDKNNNFMVDDEEIAVTELEGNGDFRSEECIELLKECDVVVTNPPFSLLREYIQQLNEYKKSFLFIGPLTAIGYKEIFKFIKTNSLWLGINSISTFQKYGSNELGKVACRWFTNIEHKKRTEEIDFSDKDISIFQKYENLNGIDIEYIKDIPNHYYGYMGVPLSFLDSFCPSQFEICGISDDSESLKEIGAEQVGEKGIAIKNACGNKSHISKGSYELYFVDENNNFKRAFRKVIIRRKKAEPIVEVETTDNVSVNEVEQNDVQQTNNVEVAETNTTSKEVYTLTRKPYSDEDMYIDSITIENGTEIANKHNTRRGIKNKSINLNNSTNDVADENLPP